MKPGAGGRRPAGPLAVGLLCLLATFPAVPASSRSAGQSISSTEDEASRKASDSCAGKVARLQKFASRKDNRRRQTTRFTETEINSYLALELSPKYHPSLRRLTVRFEGPVLRGTAVVDFDRLSMGSTKTITRVLARLLSGTHTLTVRGRFSSAEGQGNFVLDEARFDAAALPNILVEEIITAVGKKQKPPFDPMTPSTLPYRIQRVDIGSGYMDVHQ